MSRCNDLRKEETDITIDSFNVKPNSDTADTNKKSTYEKKKAHFEENKTPGTGRSQVSEQSIYNDIF